MYSAKLCRSTEKIVLHFEYLDNSTKPTLQNKPCLWAVVKLTGSEACMACYCGEWGRVCWLQLGINTVVEGQAPCLILGRAQSPDPAGLPNASAGVEKICVNP